MTRRELILNAGGALAASSLSAQTPAAVQRTEIARLPTYTEGVVVDGNGDLYVSHADTISKVTPAGNVSEWSKTPSPNGHKILADGTHLVCDRTGAVYHLDAAGKLLRTAARPPAGANDLTVDAPNGGFYFTSPYGSEREPVGKIYYVDRDGVSRQAADALSYPNGVVLRPDGRSLLVGESSANRITEFQVTAPGKLSGRREFALMPHRERFDPERHLEGPLPDGMALDEAGALYVANYGAGEVQVFDPAGRHLRSLPGSGKFTSNVAFAGPAGNQLYLTGSVGPTQQTTGLLVRLDLPGVKGLKLLP